ncbi:GNAT family N-acetyltransferase [Actinomadura macrotermitis]|uniref:N-acetyltransferase domain-containing protein n=1 Tax=Actinomadura macrotermitis TaxID=2585200 RepID=A0A7K0C8G6_9ACTN|nr:GNAT family N-acetyltransferase [Actinomadura macrotermitis]MQY09771.1 hypothetical protein [Actinomadura macrotermitis]
MDIRALTLDDYEPTRAVLAQAFGAITDADWERSVRGARPLLETGRLFGAYEDGRLVATARLHDMGQWWHGRRVSMGGVGGVAVVPEARGRGLGRALMTEVLRRCADFGHAVSMLYPATTPLYRSLGWEHAGSRDEVELRTEFLRVARAETAVPVRRAGPDDAAEVAATLRRIHEAAGDCGAVDRSEESWRPALDDRGFHYLAEDGFLSYGWDEGNTALVVARLVGASAATVRALWAVVGSGSSTAETVRAIVAPHDPVLWTLRERESERLTRTRWMLRVVDAPAAIEARGYPAGVTAEVPLEVEDPQVPANAGSWTLVVKDGEGRLERSAGHAGAVRLGPRGLAALYSGVPVATLRRAGLLAGGDTGALGAAFAAEPYALDFF